MKKAFKTQSQLIDINIGGVTPFSTIDFPGKLAAVVYTQGCNFRCHYCHNYRLVENKEPEIGLEALEAFLESRKKLIDGVVISGGEPTIHKGLPEFCKWIKEKGFAIKLDTNGTHPLMLQLLIQKGLIDFVSMDIKAPWEKYPQVIGKDFPVDVIQKSVLIIKESGLPHEFRTTVHSQFLSPTDIALIAKIADGSPLVLQICNPTDRFNVLNDYSRESLKEMLKTLPSNVSVR